MVDEYVAWYDRHHDPAWQDVVLAPPAAGGARAPWAFSVPRTPADLRAMGRGYADTIFLTAGNMTHTPGYEDYAKDLIVGDAKMLVPLGDHLKTHQPRRIFPPGSTPAYSNYATALAGYIVERVSGKPFPDYVEQFITGPLGMTRATFQQPSPSAQTERRRSQRPLCWLRPRRSPCSRRAESAVCTVMRPLMNPQILSNSHGHRCSSSARARNPFSISRQPGSDSRRSVCP